MGHASVQISDKWVHRPMEDSTTAPILLHGTIYGEAPG